MNRILVLMAEGFEETELVVPFDILVRGGVKVTLAAINNDDGEVEGAHHLLMRADAKLSEINLNDYNAVFLPGGGRGVDNLKHCEAVLDIVREFHEKKKWVTAICAAPAVLAAAGITFKHKITSYPGMDADLKKFCTAYLQDRVVVDGNVVTSRGPGTAEEFGLKVLELLEGKEAADRVHDQMVCR